MTTGNEITVEYCVSCGLMPAAEDTSHALLATYAGRLDGLRLVPSSGGVFRVDVNGDNVFDKASGEGFDIDLIKQRVGERLAPPPPLTQTEA